MLAATSVVAYILAACILAAWVLMLCVPALIIMLYFTSIGGIGNKLLVNAGWFCAPASVAGIGMLASIISIKPVLLHSSVSIALACIHSQHYQL